MSGEGYLCCVILKNNAKMAKITPAYAFPELKFVSFYTGGSLLTESYGVMNEEFNVGTGLLLDDGYEPIGS